MADGSPPPSYALHEEPCRLGHPGVFYRLQGFLIPPTNHPQGIFVSASYSSVTTANPAVGNIIHILDDADTSCPHVDHRVMLVIRHDTPVQGACRAMTCVPLYRHIGIRTEATQCHWNVEQVLEDGSRLQKDFAPSGIATADWPTLAIQLFHQNNFLQSGITINLEEYSRVEYDHVRIRLLGKVQPENLKPVLARICELFCESVLPLEPGILSGPVILPGPVVRMEAERRIGVARRPNCWTRPSSKG